ncbi:hypothetical protein [Endozoicomonas lisbonensis]|uniref:Morphogenetic protein n=1 Tax=Endozoicomonas lisbonensis TaxID=3120522 RepID=A0ABV2SQI2_9GAMM
MLAPFSLPSNPEIKIQLREMTAMEAMELSGVSPNHEEALTTSFLNATQSPDQYSNSAQWTGDDRRFALYWYALHTLNDRILSIPYDCPHCKQPHVHNFDLQLLAENYQEMKGRPYRELDGWRVVPLSGEALERLEELRMVLTDLKPDSNDYRRQAAVIRFETLAEQLTKPNDLEKDDEKRRANVREVLAGLPISRYEKLRDDVTALQKEMTHGLQSTVSNGRILLTTPPHQCPDNREVTTALQLPFRYQHYIPGL